MNFIALYWLLLAIPILLLHFISGPRKKITVASLQFWEESLQKPASVGAQRKSKLFDKQLLAIRLVLLCLLVICLIDFSFHWMLVTDENPVERVVVIVDRTASMKSKDVEPSRFEHAVQNAKQYVYNLPANCEVVLLSFASRVDVNCRLTRDHEWVMRQLSELKPTDSPGKPADAMAIAKLIVDDVKSSEIRLFSDENFPTVEDSNSFNIGITEFNAIRNRNTPEVCNVFLEIHSNNKEILETEVEFSMDSKVIDIVPVSFDVNGRYKKTFQCNLGNGGVLKAKILQNDSLNVDNLAWYTIDDPKPTKVLLISKGSAYLESVLNSIPNIEFQIQSNTDIISPEFDVAIFDQLMPKNSEKKFGIRKLFFINPETSNEFFDVKRLNASEGWVSSSTDSLAESIDWGNIDHATSSLIPITPSEILASTESGKPAFLKSKSNDYRVLAITTNLKNSNFALKAGFPILMSNAIHWLEGDSNGGKFNFASGTPVQKVFDNISDPNFTHLVSPSGEKITRANTEVLDEIGEWKIFKGEVASSKMTVSLRDKTETTNESLSPYQAPTLNRKSYHTRNALLCLSVIALLFEIFISLRMQLIRLNSLLGKTVFGIRVLVLFFLIASLLGIRFESDLTRFTQTHLIEKGLLIPIDEKTNKNQIILDEEPLDLGLIATVAMTPKDAIPQAEIWSEGRFDSGAVKNVLRRESIPITTHYQKAVDSQAIKIERLRLPESPTLGELFELNAIVWSEVDSEIQADLFVNGLKSKRKSTSLKPGRNEIDFQVRINESPRFDIKLELFSKTHDLKILDQFRISGRLKSPNQILLVENMPGNLGSISNALKTQGIRNEVQNVDQFTDTNFELSSYSSVLFANVNLNELPQDSKEKLNRFVTDEGGGFVVLGGESFIPPSSDADETMSNLLPVIKVRNNKARKQTLIFATDHSGSMRGEKLLQAKSAIAESVRNLDGETSVGIISFNEQAEWVRPPSPLNSVSFDESELSSIQASGGTEISSVLKLLEEFSGLTSDKFHTIFLTDGQTSKSNLMDPIRELNVRGMTTSVIGIGKDVDKSTLEEITRTGRGKYYHSNSTKTIPRILLRETQRIKNQNFIDKSFFVEQSKLEVALSNIDFEVTPLVAKANKVEAKENSEILLRSENNAPILVLMQIGLGKSLFFASNFEEGWANEWLEWEQFSVFLAQLIRKISKDNSSAHHFTSNFDSDSQTFQLGIESKYGEPINDFLLSGSIRNPEGSTTPFEINQNGVGTYRSNAFSGKLKPGSYEIDIFDEKLKRVHSETIQIPVPESELPGFGSEERLKSLEDFSKANKKAAWKISKPLWSYLITISLLSFFVCIVLERSRGLIS